MNIMNEDNFEIALQRIEEAAENQSDDLDLNALNLKELPESIGGLIKLQGLNLNNNQLTKLPESITQLMQLRRLFVSITQLTGLPESIGKLTHLQYLGLSKNKLTQLPESIGQLTQLQELYLGGNQLADLPASIKQLTQLKTIYLWGNGLTEVPESVTHLANLQELDLSSNQLMELPLSMIKLAKLKKLILHFNPKLGIPTELLGDVGEIYNDHVKTSNHKPQDILDFYFRVRENGRPLNEAKLILVGRGAVGKTSLVNRLIYKKFNRQESKTPGIKIDKWEIELDGGEKVNLNVWDFGGQEIMHATHQFFLTERSLYLLVLNGREGAEDADAEYWLKLIDSFGGKSPVIVVLNKISEHHFDLNRRLLLQKYPNIKEFIKTDCEDEIGIDELRNLIKKETDNLDELRVGFPSEWFAVKDRLSNMKENFLSFERYRGICKRNKVSRKQHQDMLARYLNQLGIVLNFKDDARLRDTHVLNPHWVTEGIYKLLNSPFLNERKGEIRLGEVSEVLPEKDYPVEMHRFIFDLMKKFYLCFSFPDDECHYLIPELLSKEQPPEADEFNPEECLNFQYRYAILPEGILPRFIVRTNILSRDLPRWRSGVILKFEDCLALVKADIVDKRVLISITGENAESRRRLLAVIRSDFERIHKEIPNLEVDAKVPLPDYPDEVVSYDDLLVMERENKLEYPVVVNRRIVNVKVRDLLNGVDLARVKDEQEEMPGVKSDTVNLFYSYSHKDETLRNELDTQLKILHRLNLISSWYDRQIDPGDEWKKEIDKNLESADIILLLVSADFIASDYCYEKEMKRALERDDKGEAVVIPVIIRDTNWQKAPFAELQALPENAKPVTTWENRDSAWRNVSEGIQKVAERIHSEKKR
jgi:internalin A